MNLIINTLSVNARAGGIRTYLLHMVGALARLPSEDHLVLLCSEANRDLFAGFEGPHVEIRVLPLGSTNRVLRILFDQLVLPLHLLRDARSPAAAATVLITPSSVATILSPLPQVVIVQAPLSVRSVRNEVAESAETLSWLQRLYFDFGMPIGLRRAQRVIAVSNHLRDHLIRTFPRVAGKIEVVHEGVDASEFRPRPPDWTPARTGPVVLFVSTLFPYKNAGAVLDAYALLVNRKLVPDDARVVVAGKDPDGRQLPALQGRANALGVRDRVEFLGMVPREQMPALYHEATVVVYPSLMETFGLPILEAMSSGVPVIASNRMSVPEVAGEAGVIVDPTDVEELAHRIHEVIASPDLRERMKEKGLARVAEMTWERSAQALLDHARSIIGAPGRNPSGPAG